MRLLLDTNVVVAGLLWSGHSRTLMSSATDETVSLCSSPTLIDELHHTLTYPKFAKRVALFNTTPANLVTPYSALATLIEPDQVPRVITSDPDDDHVSACAASARAHLIVTGDQHLHNRGGQYQGIRIVTLAEATAVIERL